MPRPAVRILSSLLALSLAGCGGASAQAPSTAGASGDPVQVLEGRASYYADSLAGNSTASGEPYDPSALTAASRDLP